MGGRRLRSWIEAPLLNYDEIIKRQNAVETLIQNKMLMDELIENLKSVYDMERLISKIVSSSANARELVSLKTSLEKLPKIKNILKNIINTNNDTYMNELYSEFSTLENIYSLINNSIVDDPPISIKEGGIIKSGYNEQIDEYRNASKDGKNGLWNLRLKKKN